MALRYLMSWLIPFALAQTMPSPVFDHATQTGLASLAALKAASLTNVTAGSVVHRSGFATAGDGGAADYVYSTAACTLNAGAGDNGSQVKPNVGVGCWNADLGPGPNDIRIWGAVANASTDNSAAIAAAMRAGVALVPCTGTAFYIASTVAMPTSGNTGILGVSPSCSIIGVNFATGDVFTPSGLTNFRMEHLTLNGVVTHTSGVMIILANDFTTIIRDIFFTGSRNTDIAVESSNTTYISNTYHRPGASGICVYIGGGQNVEVLWQNSTTANCGYGLEIDNASGVYLANLDIGSSVTYGVSFNPIAASNQFVNAVRAVNVLADTTTAGNNWSFQGTGAITAISIVQGWGNAAGQTGPTTYGNYLGLYANNPALDGLTITDFNAEANGGAGMYFGAGKNITLSNVHACMNSRNSSGFAPGITIDVNVDYVQIEGLLSGACGTLVQPPYSLTNYQSYGLNVVNSSTKHITVIGGQYPGNLTGSWVHPTGANFISAGTPP